MKHFLYLIVFFSTFSFSQIEKDSLKIQSKKDSINNEIDYDLIYESINVKNKRQFIDKEMPFFIVKDIDGNTFDSSKTKRLVFYNFWFKGCVPCVLETDMLNHLQSEFKEQVEFISLTFETKEDILQFVKIHPFNFRHISVNKEFLNNLDVNSGYPNSILVFDGKIVEFRLGGPSDPKSDYFKLSLFGTYYKFRSAIEQKLKLITK